jgi:hypothetical protein
MSPEELGGIIITVGSLLPLPTAILQQPTWGRRKRALVALLLSVVAGAVTWVSTHGLDWSTWKALIGTVIGVVLSSGTAYLAVWKPLGVAPALEDTTSPKPPEPDPDAAPVPEEEEAEVDSIPDDDDEELPEVDIPEMLEEPTGFDDGSAPVR